MLDSDIQLVTAFTCVASVVSVIGCLIILVSCFATGFTGSRRIDRPGANRRNGHNLSYRWNLVHGFLSETRNHVRQNRAGRYLHGGLLHKEVPSTGHYALLHRCNEGIVNQFMVKCILEQDKPSDIEDAFSVMGAV